MTVTPIDLFSSALRLQPGGEVQAGPQVFEDRDGWQVMAFRARTDADLHADHWEVHDEAEEVVCCLRGGIRMFFRGDERGDDEQVALSAGAAVIVPRGRWHRIELSEASDVMAIGVLRGTRLERRTNP